MFEFSEIQNNYFFLPLIGFVIGIFGTILGGGGGFFSFPFLHSGLPYLLRLP